MSLLKDWRHKRFIAYKGYEIPHCSFNLACLDAFSRIFSRVFSLETCLKCYLWYLPLEAVTKFPVERKWKQKICKTYEI